MKNGGQVVNGTNCGIGGIGINGNGSDDMKRAAYLFAIWSTSKDTQFNVLKGVGGTPTRKSVMQIPEVAEARKRPTKMPNALTFDVVYDFGIKDPNFVLGPKIPSANEYHQIIATELQKCVAGKQTAEEACQAIKQQVDDLNDLELNRRRRAPCPPSGTRATTGLMATAASGASAGVADRGDASSLPAEFRVVDGVRIVEHTPAHLNPTPSRSYYFLLMAPAIIVLAAISLYPFFWLIWMSLHTVELRRRHLRRHEEFRAPLHAQFEILERLAAAHPVQRHVSRGRDPSGRGPRRHP